jgi:hypothetical protein
LDKEVGEKMNKGIIMEVKKNYAIALNDKGIMSKIQVKENMKVGQKIFYFEDDIISNISNSQRYNSFIKAIGSIAAIFLIVFTFFHTMKPQEAYAVVSLDINPSIQIEADNQLNIIKVEGVNDDGKNIDFSDIKDVSLENGMKMIKDKLAEKKYLETNKDVLVGYAFVKNGDDSKYEEDLKNVIDSTFSTQDIVYVKGDKEAVDEAKTKGISLGRYEAAESGLVDQNIKNTISTAPVKEITASIKDRKDDGQWDAQDQKDSNTQSPNVKSEGSNDKTVAEKPNADTASDNTGSNVDTGKGIKDSTNKTAKDDNMIEVQPDAPTQNVPSGNTGNSNANTGSSTTSSKDNNSIDAIPNNGSNENNTTSSKVGDGSGQVSTSDQSKK